METRARLLGHPIHQMLIVFPLGVLTMAVIFDVIAMVTENGDLFIASSYMLCAGIISALVAAIFGLIDYLGIPSGTRAKRVGRVHGIGNVIVVVLFAISWYLRHDNISDPGMAAVLFGIAGAGLAGFTGWLGGELVNRLGVGVSDGANLNAPSSISGRPAQ